MDLLENIATIGGPIGILASVLLLTFKKDKKDSDKRHDKNDIHLKELTSEIKGMREEICTLRVDTGKISTAFSILVSENFEFKKNT